MVVSQSVMIVSEINIRGTSHVGSAIKSLASMIGFVLKSQSSTEQRVKMKMLLRSLLKCSIFTDEDRREFKEVTHCRICKRSFDHATDNLRSQSSHL